ncbi:MAG: HNH endonuclease signature motif containing protein [Anaerolineaceae bacterium]|nr:HNH endonuclease signature motif containing protein [Anaerolineaceae bacterium]
MEITYIENGKRALFNGRLYHLKQSQGYYFWRGYKCGSSLHRDVYAFYNGDIPKNHDIHHKDGNRANNEITNLECILSSAHLSNHLFSRSKDLRDYTNKVLKEKALPAAIEWHKSEVGRAWHKQHWLNHVDDLFRTKTLTCDHCEKVYVGRDHGTSHYCSKNCVSAARRARGVDNEIRKCVICEKEFTQNKYSRVTVCSRHCGGVLRHRKEKVG